MELLDRYLASVRLFLPRDQRDDIAAELRDVLLTQQEEKEAALGRPLTRREQEALLHDFGHPLMVAARYRRPQHLIGPELYPVYEVVALVVLASIGLAALITGVVAASVSGDAWRGFGSALGVAWSGLFTGIGVVTIIFAALERTKRGRELVVEWKVRDLPRFVTGRGHREHWYEHVAGMAVMTLFILWWVGIIRDWPPQIPLDSGGALRLAFAPALQSLYYPVLALAAGGIAVNALKLAGRETRAIALVLDMALQAGIGAVAGLALNAGSWSAVSGAGVPAAVLAKVQYGIDIGAEVTLIVVICGAAIRFCVSGWRLLRPAPGAQQARRGA